MGGAACWGLVEVCLIVAGGVCLDGGEGGTTRVDVGLLGLGVLM